MESCNGPPPAALGRLRRPQGRLRRPPKGARGPRRGPLPDTLRPLGPTSGSVARFLRKSWDFLGNPGISIHFLDTKNWGFLDLQAQRIDDRPATPDDQNRPQTRFFQVQRMFSHVSCSIFFGNLARFWVFRVWPVWSSIP